MILGKKIEEADFADKNPLLQSLINLFCQDKSGEMVCCEKGKNSCQKRDDTFYNVTSLFGKNFSAI